MAGRKIGEAFLRVRPDTTGFARDAQPTMLAAGTHLGGLFGGSFKRVLGPLAAAVGGLFAARAAIGFAHEALEEQREAQRMGRLTAAVIKSTGAAAKVSQKQVEGLADSLGELAGVDDETIQSGENLLLTFTKVRNETGKGNDIFNQAAKAAEDMSAAMNNGQVTTEGFRGTILQIGKALNDPVRGMNALRRAGVTFDEQQKKTIKSLVAQGKTAEAQKIILRELAKEFGGAAAAAADPIQKAQVAWANFKEELGQFVLPIVGRLSTIFTTKLLPVLRNQLVPGIQAMIAAFQGGGVTSDGFIGRMELLGVKLAQVWVVIQTKVIPAIRQFAGWVRAELVPRLVALGQYLITNILPVLKDLAIRGFRGAQEAAQKLQKVWQEHRTELMQLWRGFKTVAQFVIEKVLPVLGPLLTASIKSGIAMIRVLIAWIANWVRAFNLIKTAVTAAVGWVKTKIGELIGLFKSLPGRIASAVGGLKNLLFSAGRDVINGLINGITGRLRALRDIGKTIGGIVANAAKSVLGIGSPSKVFMGYGRDTVRGYVQGIDREGGRLAGAMNALLPTGRGGATTSGLMRLHPDDLRALARALGDRPIVLHYNDGTGRRADLYARAT